MFSCLQLSKNHQKPSKHKPEKGYRDPPTAAIDCAAQLRAEQLLAVIDVDITVDVDININVSMDSSSSQSTAPEHSSSEKVVPDGDEEQVQILKDIDELDEFLYGKSPEAEKTETSSEEAVEETEKPKKKKKKKKGKKDKKKKKAKKVE